jgi:hypothetical protein
MTPLRWNWSANTHVSLKPGTRGASRAPTGPLDRQLTDTMVEHRSLPPSPAWAGRGSEGRSGSKGAKGQRGRRIVARRLAQCPRGASRAPTGPLDRQLTDTMVEHRSLPPSPPWAGRDGEGRSGSKGGEGPARGGNRCPPRRRSLFQPTIPASSAATISKMPLKPLLLLG